MTTKLSKDVVKESDCSRGSAGSNRVTWNKAENFTCGVVKVSGIRATINLLEYHPQKGSIHPNTKRRVLLNEIEPLDIGSNDRHHAKSSRGFVVGDYVNDGCSFGTIRIQNPKDVTVAWDTNDCSPHPTLSFLARWQVYQELEKCSYNLTSVAGLVQDSRLLDSLPEDSSLKDYAKSINSVMTDCAIASLKSPSTTTCGVSTSLTASLISSVPAHHASPFPLMANVEVQQMSATVSPPYSTPLTQCNQASLPLKTSQDCSVALNLPVMIKEHISESCSMKFTAAGTMRNGFVSTALGLERPGLESGYCWLPRPGALSSSSSKSRPPGANKFENKCRELGLMQKVEVANPTFLEGAFGLPIGWTNPLELRAATELLESNEQPSEIASIQDLQKSHFSESSTSIASSNNESVANILNMITCNSTQQTAAFSNQAVTATFCPRVSESKPDAPYDSSKLVKIEAQAEVLEELTYDEENDRHRLELRVERAFYEAGKALADLRNRRLYRSTHRTFEAYCCDRFEFSHRHVNYLVAGSQVVENLQMGTNGSQILPTRERQVRPLIDLEPDLQCEVWQQAVESAGGKVPSGRVVQGIVERLKAKPLFLAKDFCQVGDVFVLTRLEGKEKKYNGCWAIATDLKDFTVMVDVHDTALIVKPENLDKIDLPDVKCQLPQILKRIRRVRQAPQFRDSASAHAGLRVAYTVLEHLGRQTYLTPLEDRILRLIEQECGVEDSDC